MEHSAGMQLRVRRGVVLVALLQTEQLRMTRVLLSTNPLLLPEEPPLKPRYRSSASPGSCAGSRKTKDQHHSDSKCLLYRGRACLACPLPESYCELGQL